jgi:CDP-diacylglycerol--serine O-phosphatidyltransferase
VLPLFFASYLIYGFFRPYISRAWRREIEEEDEDKESEMLD